METDLLCVDHLGAPTWDAESAADFYRRLGVSVVHEESVEDYNIHAVFLDVDGVYVEFLEPTGPGPAKTFLERHGPGFQHVAYRVPDVDVAVAELREAGVGFQTDEPLEGVGDARVIFVEETDTAGFQTELVEREEDL